jgi:hypothetical protein
MPTPDSPHHQTGRPLVTSYAMAPAIEIRAADGGLLVRIDLITREVYVLDEGDLEEASPIFWQYLRSRVAA